jgi:hypothetical protein
MAFENSPVFVTSDLAKGHDPDGQPGKPTVSLRPGFHVDIKPPGAAAALHWTSSRSIAGLA